jgi:dynein heavy chain
MGYICIVTNCGESLDYKVMGSLFSGLVQTGAWGCFDEFNRIDVEVLSVVSSQLTTIQDALNQNKNRFEFINREITMKPSVGFFVTMNPGYAGRTELPDNLKALFRPVTMVPLLTRTHPLFHVRCPSLNRACGRWRVQIVPDLLQICEIMLFSEGFNQARFLAKKMTVLYRLASEQLSRQFHYDFGLRALKSVLVMAGALKRGQPDLDEESVLMGALHDMNLPKFVHDDEPLFEGLLKDLFPDRKLRSMPEPNLEAAITDYMKSVSPFSPSPPSVR